MNFGTLLPKCRRADFSMKLVAPTPGFLQIDTKDDGLADRHCCAHSSKTPPEIDTSHDRFWHEFWADVDRTFFHPIVSPGFRLSSVQYMSRGTVLHQLIGRMIQLALSKDDYCANKISLTLEEFLLLRRVNYSDCEFQSEVTKAFVVLLRRARLKTLATENKLAKQFESLAELHRLNNFRRNQLNFLARLYNASFPYSLSLAEQGICRYYLLMEQQRRRLQNWLRSLNAAEFGSHSLRLAQENSVRVYEIRPNYPFYAQIRCAAERLARYGAPPCHFCQQHVPGMLIMCGQAMEEAGTPRLVNKGPQPRADCRRNFCLPCLRGVFGEHGLGAVFVCPYCRGLCSCEGCKSEKRLKWIAEKLTELSDEPFFLEKFDFSVDRVLRFSDCYYQRNRALRIFANKHLLAFHLKELKEECPELLERLSRVEAANYLLIVSGEERLRGEQIQEVISQIA